MNRKNRSYLTLFVSLCLLAYPGSGTVLVDRLALAAIINLRPEILDRKLDAMERRQWIRIRTRGSYLALSIRSWPGEATSGENPGLEIRPLSPPSIPPPGSASAETEKQNRSAGTENKKSLDAEQSLGDGKGSLRGKEEGWLEPFLDRLVRTVDAPEERSSYRSFCRRYPRLLLERALDRVRQTPKARIRKSRGALFTYLVKTFDQTSKKP